MTDGEIRSVFLCLSQAMSNQYQEVATEAHSMTSQAHREVGPRVQRNDSTMASHLKNFKRMNPLMFHGSKVNEDPQDILDKVYKIL